MGSLDICASHNRWILINNWFFPFVDPCSSLHIKFPIPVYPITTRPFFPPSRFLFALPFSFVARKVFILCEIMTTPIYEANYHSADLQKRRIIPSKRICHPLGPTPSNPLAQSSSLGSFPGRKPGVLGPSFCCSTPCLGPNGRASDYHFVPRSNFMCKLSLRGYAPRLTEPR